MINKSNYFKICPLLMLLMACIMSNLDYFCFNLRREILMSPQLILRSHMSHVQSLKTNLLFLSLIILSTLYRTLSNCILELYFSKNYPYGRTFIYYLLYPKYLWGFQTLVFCSFNRKYYSNCKNNISQNQFRKYVIFLTRNK